MKRNWIRVLKVILRREDTNGKVVEMVFGNNFPNWDLEINVSIHKYMSALKDTATITISNLTYSQVIQIINGKLYNVEVIAGYQNGNQMCVFKGQVLRISNTLLSDRTNEIIILCGSSMIAKYSQRFLNFSLQSGLNTYSAIKFITARAGIKDGDSNVSTQLKKDFLQQVQTETKSVGSFLENLTQNNETYILNVDESNGVKFSIYDSAVSNNRVINLKGVQFLGGYPQLDSNGLRFTILPTFSFMVGDVILVENALISLSPVNSLSNINQQAGYYLDTSRTDGMGAYMIMELSYKLTNRSSQFSCSINAKARSLISNYIGVK